MATTQPTPRQGSPALWNGSVLRARAAAAPSWYAGAHAAERVRPSVLVCDDDSQNLRALKAVLSSAGFAVDATSTSNQALDHAALRAPIAAIVELVLPDGDGVELCRALREWSTMPLIVLSAINEEAHKVRALHAGADDYLTKPFGAQELVARLHATLRRASPTSRNPASRSATSRSTWPRESSAARTRRSTSHPLNLISCVRWYVIADVC